MLLTMLIIKGIAALATKGVAVLAVKSALAFGVAATIKGLLIAGVTVGGVVWVSEAVDAVGTLVDALAEGDQVRAVSALVRITRKLHCDVDNLPVDLGNYLHHVNVDAEKTSMIVDSVKELLPLVKAEIMKSK